MSLISIWNIKKKWTAPLFLWSHTESFCFVLLLHKVNHYPNTHYLFPSLWTLLQDVNMADFGFFMYYHFKDVILKIFIQHFNWNLNVLLLEVLTLEVPLDKCTVLYMYTNHHVTSLTNRSVWNYNTYSYASIKTTDWIWRCDWFLPRIWHNATEHERPTIHVISE